MFHPYHAGVILERPTCAGRISAPQHQAAEVALGNGALGADGLALRADAILLAVLYSQLLVAVLCEGVGPVVGGQY